MKSYDRDSSLPGQREPPLMTRAGSPSTMDLAPPAKLSVETHRPSLGGFFKRKLDRDLIIFGDDGLRVSGIQQQLEFEGFQLRWVTTNKVDENLADGWQYVTVSRYLWWHRRVRRRHGQRNQYLLKRVKSFR